MLTRPWIAFLLVFTLVACAGGAQVTPEPVTSTPERPPLSPTATDPPQPELSLTAEPTAPGETPQPSPNPSETTPPTVQPLAEDKIIYQIIPGESTVTYEVGEVFLNQGNAFNVAIGITPQVSGEVIIDRNNPQNSSIGQISVDISQFQSDSSRRDNAIRSRFLESNRFPLATFTTTAIEGLPQTGEEGVDYPLKITGDLTIRQVTRQVAFDATVRLDSGTLTGEASITILMSDFSFGPISILGAINTEDEVHVTMRFVARP